MIETNFTPFPVLTTDRLILREPEPTDDEDIFLHRGNESVNTYVNDFRHSSIEQTQAFIDRVQKEIALGKTILWVITQKGRNKFIGTVCLWNISKEESKAETGYTLDPGFQRMGYMNEALAAVIEYGFNKMKLMTIEAYTHERSEGSIRLLQRNKFKQNAIHSRAAGSNRVFFILKRDDV